MSFLTRSGDRWPIPLSPCNGIEMLGLDVVEQFRRSHFLLALAPRPVASDGMRNMQLENMGLKHVQVVQFRLTVLPFTRIHWIRHRSRNRDGDFNPGHRFRAHHLVLLRFRRLGWSTPRARCVWRFVGLCWRGSFLRRGFSLLLRLCRTG